MSLPGALGPRSAPAPRAPEEPKATRKAVEVDRLFAWQRENDTRGLRFQWACAAASCLMVMGPASMVEWALAPAVVCTLIRIRWTWPMANRLGEQASSKWLMAWIAWCGVAMAWTLDRTQGLDDFGTLRFAVLIPCLWPAMERRGLMVRCLIAGAFAANIVQFLSAAGVGSWDGIGWLVRRLTWSRDVDRHSAWWQPVVGGSLLVAALGMHLPAAFLGPARTRMLGLTGVLASAAGIALTGSRGAWLAAMALAVVFVLFAISRVEDRRKLLGVIPLAACGALLLGLGAWKAMGPALERRFSTGVAEVRAALEHGDYTTDTGKRIYMFEVGWHAVQQRPLVGVGIGGFRKFGEQDAAAHGLDPAVDGVHAHAHNTPMQIMVTLGAVGLAIAGTSIVLIGLGEWRRLRGTARHSYPRWCGYEAGPAFALLGLCIAGITDSIHINQQTSAVLYVLIALCTPLRPVAMDEAGVDAERDEQGADADGPAAP
ncbi:MAG: O-antigen ligase family protein [Phycisphaeraceae bacterium]|nr:O-antigen ligase family protein [Phycisphaeraceae bacterium]